MIRCIEHGAVVKVLSSDGEVARDGELRVRLIFVEHEGIVVALLLLRALTGLVQEVSLFCIRRRAACSTRRQLHLGCGKQTRRELLDDVSEYPLELGFTTTSADREALPEKVDADNQVGYAVLGHQRP